jgi:glyoxylase-like metal-dependent hydrolase (beta-lactamase superfamily II)
VRTLAPGVRLLRGFPPEAINAYLVGDVLIDAGTRHARRRILRQLRHQDVRAHALTHGHPDHQGASHRVCEALGLPLWVGEGDVEAVEGGPPVIAMRQRPGIVNRLQERFWTGPAHPVARVLREGDEVAGFTVLEVPGHSRGHIAFWRERDRVLVAGDVVTTIDVRTGRRGLHEPLAVFTPDVAANRASIRRLAALGANLLCVGHGPPLRDPAALVRFASRLPG